MANKVYIVIQDPDQYEHYDSVHPTLEDAKQYILTAEHRDKVESCAHIYGRAYFDAGRWTTYTGDVHNGMEMWGYPGSGNTYGIIAEELPEATDGRSDV